MSSSNPQKDTHSLNPDQRLHEIKRYLTHLQSYVFLAKVALENNEISKAKSILEKHEATLQILSQLLQSEFKKVKE